jgi:hypothetical protein
MDIQKQTLIIFINFSPSITNPPKTTYFTRNVTSKHSQIIKSLHTLFSAECKDNNITLKSFSFNFLVSSFHSDQKNCTNISLILELEWFKIMFRVLESEIYVIKLFALFQL